MSRVYVLCLRKGHEASVVLHCGFPADSWYHSVNWPLRMTYFEVYHILAPLTRNNPTIGCPCIIPHTTHVLVQKIAGKGWNREGSNSHKSQPGDIKQRDSYLVLAVLYCVVISAIDKRWPPTLPSAHPGSFRPLAFTVSRLSY